MPDAGYSSVDSKALQWAGKDDPQKPAPKPTIDITIGDRSPEQVRDDWKKYRDEETRRRAQWKPPKKPVKTMPAIADRDETPKTLPPDFWMGHKGCITDRVLAAEPKPPRPVNDRRMDRKLAG